MAKTLIFGHFEPKRSKIAKLSIFFENRASSLFYPYYGLTSYEKAKKFLEWKYNNFCDRLTDWLTDWQTKLDLKDPTRGSKKEVNCSFCCLFRYCWVCLLGNNLGIFGFVVILSGRYRGVIIDGAYYVTYLHKRLKYSDDWLWCSNPMFPPRPPLVPQRRISTWKLFRLIRLVLNSLK